MKFSDVVGHDQTVERLQRAVASRRLPHAYLFAGPDGVGKYTVARALAARLLCENPGDDACGACSACLGLAREAHPDLVIVRVMEGASEIKIDQARELQRRLRLRPLRGRYKVAILDEANRLNLSAQHALLKTFEEPPGSTVLILVASNVAALLPTVVSRCQRVTFFPLPDDLVARLLVERCSVLPEEAAELARYGEGSVSHALLFRTELIGRARAELLPLLRDLRTRPYADLAELAQDWGRLPAGDLALVLRAPLHWYRQRLIHVSGTADAALGAIALSQLRVIHDTIERVRHNVHRQLALDAMFLELQRLGDAPTTVAPGDGST
jgi:DNA polymerase-3 subunit delta'